MLPFPYKDENPTAGDKTAVVALIAANVLAMPFWTHEIFTAYGFIPSNPEPHRWIATLFLHAGVSHLVGNMWSLWLFGDNVAAKMGRLFLPFYMAAGFSATGMHMWLSPESATPLIGASGAISGVIGAYLVLFPGARLRCIFFLVFKPIFFSMSAGIFGLLFVLWQFAMVQMNPSGGVAYGAHLGGALFGLLIGSLYRTFTEDGDIQSSGPAGEAPQSESAAAPIEIERAIERKSGKEAIETYLREIRKNPYFELPESSQLWIGDVLSRAGRPHLALNALEKFVLRHPFNPLTAHAHLLSGAVQENYFKDYAGALRSYRRALSHKNAAEQTIEEAKSRSAGMEKSVAKTFLNEPETDARYWILLETVTEISPSQWRSISYILGESAAAVQKRFQEYPGFVAYNLPMGEASAVARQLESISVPVVVLPRSDLFELPQARLMTGIKIDSEGMEFDGPHGERARVAWPSCLLIAGVGIPSGPGVHPVTEVLAYYPEKVRKIERFRWAITPDQWGSSSADEEYYVTLQEMVLKAASVSVNRGARDSFYRRVPSELVFSSHSSLDAYISWELHLAYLRKKGY